jgi:hypothetical protein
MSQAKGNSNGRRKRKAAETDWPAFERKVADFHASRGLLPDAAAGWRASLDRLVDLAIHTGRAKWDDLENAAKLSLYLSGGQAKQGVTQ